MPAVATGTAVGIVSVIGYTPDVFFGGLAGWLLDAAPGVAGQRHFFLMLFAFVALGFEHSIANMFMIPLGIALGSTASASGFLFSHLLPVTLGNIIGGAVCCAPS